MNTTPRSIRHRSGRLPLLAIASTLAAAILPGIAAPAPPPVKVFILAGQSNMEGHGKVEMGRDPEASGPKAAEVKGGLGCLRHLVKHDPDKYGGLVDDQGDWIVRDDVWIWSTTDKGCLGMVRLLTP